MTREVLLTGGLPVRPASRAFETVAQELGDLVCRISDGDQAGWVYAVFSSFATSDALESMGTEKCVPGGVDIPIFRPRDGLTAADLTLGPYGYAETAIESYAEFKRLRDDGVIAPGTRFQVTLPGPLTTVLGLRLLPAEQLITLATGALVAELEALFEAIPAADVAIQLDVAIEVEREECRRDPDAFDAPMHATLPWSEEQMLDAVATVANHVPADAELGFHLCSMWHHYQAGGQDNRVLVDIANEIHKRLTRPLTYVHIPTTPEHGEADFDLLRALALDSDTKLYLELLHMSDGLDGARKRIAAAETALSDFGVAHFCGLNAPTGRDETKLPGVMELHRDAATSA